MTTIQKFPYNESETKGKFGSYIDVYDIQQSISDKATAPNNYEGRLIDLRIFHIVLERYEI